MYVLRTSQWLVPLFQFLNRPRPGPVKVTAARHATASAVRLCVAADVERFSRFCTPEAARAQMRFVEVLADARAYAGIDEEHVELQCAGDGQFAVLPPALDESLVLPRLVEGLVIKLAEINADLNEHARLRIRVAVHRGFIGRGVNGWLGDCTIAVHRLLDAQPVRQALRGCLSSDLALIVADSLYQDVIAHSFGLLRPNQFQRVRAEMPDKDFAEEAWVYVCR